MKKKIALTVAFIISLLPMLMNQYGGLKGVQEITGLINLLNPIGIISVILFVVGVWMPFKKKTIGKILGALGTVGIVASEIYMFFTWHVMTITGEVSIHNSIEFAFPEFYIGLVVSLAMILVYFISQLQCIRKVSVKFSYEELTKYRPYNEAEAVQKQVMLEFWADNGNVFDRGNKIAHFTTSAWIVNKSRTKVLMAYHNLYNSWGWLGGHADGDRDLYSVILKEVKEECGLTGIRPLYEGIYGINILTVFPHYKRGNYVNAHLHFDVEYLFEADEEDEVRMKPDENSGVEWVPIEAIDELVTEEHMKPVYAVLNEKLGRYLDYQRR